MKVEIDLRILGTKKFLSLSSNAKLLFFHMKFFANNLNMLEYSSSCASDLFSRVTFIKTRQELINAGLIEFTNELTAKKKRQAGIYRFLPFTYLLNGENIDDGKITTGKIYSKLCNIEKTLSKEV